MYSPEPLAVVLRDYMGEKHFTPGRLAELTDIPEETIKGWSSGRGKRVRDWKRVLLLAAVLELNREELHRLLRAAQAPTGICVDQVIQHMLSILTNEHLRAVVERWSRQLTAQEAPAQVQLQPQSFPVHTNPSAPLVPARSVSASRAGAHHYLEGLLRMFGWVRKHAAG